MKMRPSVVYWLPHNNTQSFSIYLNATNKCPNNCYFCFRKFKNGVRGFNLRLRKEPSAKDVLRELQKVIKRKNWREIVFCGFGEPLERLDCILDVTRWVKKHYGKAVRINTNGQGYLLNEGREVVKELKNAGVDKVSVSLNAHDKATYNQVCKPEFEDAFERILEFVEETKKENLDTEITAVTIAEAAISKVRELAESIGVGFRIREYNPCLW